MQTVTKKTLEIALANRINEAEAELRALKSVAINSDHKTLTNKAVWAEVEGVEAKIGDYLGIGKALYIYYQYRKDGVFMSTQKLDITAYTYNNPDGTEIGTIGIMRQSRTMTPAELQEVLNATILGREISLGKLKMDLGNADKIIKTYNKHAQALNELLDGVTWATRGVLK